MELMQPIALAVEYLYIFMKGYVTIAKEPVRLAVDPNHLIAWLASQGNIYMKGDAFYAIAVAWHVLVPYQPNAIAVQVINIFMKAYVQNAMPAVQHAVTSLQVDVSHVLLNRIIYTKECV